MNEKKYLVTEDDLLGSADLCEHCVGNDEDCHGDYLCEAIANILESHEYEERTCHDDGTIVFRCDECGAFVQRSAVMDCCDTIPIRFCPNCGAEVVGA